MSFIETKDGTKIAYKMWGQGRPVIFIHGWPLCGDSWDAIACSIAEAGFTAISYDRRGFGKSDQPWIGFDYNSLTDDLNAVIDNLRLEDATLVGFSMGGGEVINYPHRFPTNTIRSLVLISSIVPMLASPKGPPPSLFEDMMKRLRADRCSFYSEFFSDFFNVGVLKSPVSNAVLEWHRSMAMQASLKAALECIQSFAFTDFRAIAVKEKRPTLILHGEADKVVPLATTSAEASVLLTNAKLVTIPGASHGLLETHRERVLAELLPFLLEN